MNFKRLISRVSNSLSVLVLALAVFVAAGCGSSSNDFVAVGGGSPGATTATFNFIKAQNVLEVSQDTLQIRFEFFDGPAATGNITLDTTRDFASRIVISGVPVGTQSVRVTTLDAAGNVLGTAIAESVIIAGTNIDVDLSSVTLLPNITGMTTTPLVSTLAILDTATLTTTGSFAASADRALSNAVDGLTYTSNNTAVASVDNNGVVTAVGQGSAIITAQVGTTTSNVTILVSGVNAGTPPTLTVDGNELYVVAGSAAAPIYPNAVFGSTLANLDGGTLTLNIAQGSTTGIVITAPNTPNIGNIVNNGTAAVTVALSGGATPAGIQTFLRAVTVASAAADPGGLRVITVTVTDQTTASVAAQRNYAVASTAAFDLTVPGDFADLQLAINDVRDNGASFSRITVASGDFGVGGGMTSTNGDYTVIDDPELEGLRLIGANAGISAGAVPGTRGAETIITSLVVNAPGVVLDGFRVNHDGGGESGVFLDVNPPGFQTLNNIFDGTNSNDEGLKTKKDGPANGLVVRGSMFYNWDKTALKVESLGNLVVVGNAFLDNTDRGIEFKAISESTTTFTGNAFHNNNEHLKAKDGGGVLVGTGNQFTGNGLVKVEKGTSVDARNSWWGQNTGPLMAQIEEKDGQVVIFDPFSTVALFATPTAP
jgi:Right handed beta helix region/Bacterial Ig-like domain